MYASIMELPTQVQNSLDEDDQKIWMDAYNALNPQDPESVREAKRDAWKACLKLPSSFSFNIIASVGAVDKTREIIDIPTLEQHMDDYIDRGGNVQLDHNNYTVGTIWDWKPIEVDGYPGVEVWGNLFGGDKVYDLVRKNFVRGLNSLSVAGESKRGRYQCDEQGCYVRRSVEQLLEISICKIPANRYATMKWYNEDASFTKSSDDTVDLYVQSYTVHRDYTTCPILGLRKSLTDAGFRCHAREDGVLVDMDWDSFVKSVPRMVENGIHGRWTPEGVLCNTKASMLEHAFRKCWENGWVESDGRLRKSIPREEFESLYADGLLDDGFRLNAFGETYHKPRLNRHVMIARR